MATGDDKEEITRKLQDISLNSGMYKNVFYVSAIYEYSLRIHMKRRLRPSIRCKSY